MAVYKIYCDESRQSQGKYMLIGGIWILKEEALNFVKEFEYNCATKLGLVKKLGHMKWTKVPAPNHVLFPAYQHLVDLYFDYNAAGKMFFRTIIVDKTQYDFTDNKFSRGDYEKGFYNLYSQLIFNWLEKDSEYHIRIATRSIKKSFPGDSEGLRLKLLKEKLNEKFFWQMNKYRQIFGWKEVADPVKTIESKPAESRRLIQLADLFAGAVGYHWSEEDRKNTAKLGKVTLAQYIARKLSRNDLKFTTDWQEKSFNIFFFDTTRRSTLK